MIWSLEGCLFGREVLLETFTHLTLPAAGKLSCSGILGYPHAPEALGRHDHTHGTYTDTCVTSTNRLLNCRDTMLSSIFGG